MLHERQLWTAVLRLAFEDLENRKIAPRARFWFNSSKTGPGSFLWVCENLELDPKSIRRRVLEVIERGADLSVGSPLNVTCCEGALGRRRVGDDQTYDQQPLS
jgi:hypothetical protein